MAYGITPQLVEHVKQQEGWRAKPYRCQAGKPTIGYGHRIPSMAYAPLTREEGEALLRQDLRERQETVLRLSPILAHEPEARCSAILDFVFNVGGAAYASSTLRKRVNDGRWQDAANEMRRWVYATDPETGEKRKLSALVKRREVTAGWLKRGAY